MTRSIECSLVLASFGGLSVFATVPSTIAVVMPARDAHLVMRGLKTLTLRMDRHCQSAQKVAELLERHAATAVVHFPGLPSFAQHALAKRQMRQFGGMIAFDHFVSLENAISLPRTAPDSAS